MIMTFKGKDGSNGFKRGEKYNVATRVADGYLWLYEKRQGLKCPYTNLESLLSNWELFQDNLETIADEVIAGKWGQGDARWQLLLAKGHNPYAIQQAVYKRFGKKEKPSQIDDSWDDF